MNTVIGLFNNYTEAKRAAVITSWLIPVTCINIVPIAPGSKGFGSPKESLKGMMMVSDLSREDVELNAEEEQKGGVLVFVGTDAQREEQVRDILGCNGVIRMNPCPQTRRDKVEVPYLPTGKKYGGELIDIYLSQSL